MLLSVLDSYYSYVVQQMTTLGATAYINGATVAQPFGGLTNARDWPQTPFTEGALYLLYIAAVPGGKSKTQQQYTFHCQWTWILLGTDIQAAQTGQNRGDRYRSDMTIFNNLQQASYPGFCRKQDYSVNTTTGVVSSQPSQSAFPYSTVESIIWTTPKAIPKIQEKSGLDYGAATVEITGFEDISALVA